jgi:hypothetical protein
VYGFGSETSIRQNVAVYAADASQTWRSAREHRRPEPPAHRQVGQQHQRQLEEGLDPQHAPPERPRRRDGPGQPAERRVRLDQREPAGGQVARDEGRVAGVRGEDVRGDQDLFPEDQRDHEDQPGAGVVARPGARRDVAAPLIVADGPTVIHVDQR